MKRTLPALLSLLFLHCADIVVDQGELDVGPTVEFDPSSGVIPIPNILLLDPSTGLLNIPAGCGESLATQVTRTGTLNQLDGFGTFKSAIQVTFTSSVELATVVDRVKLFQRVSAGGPVDPLVVQEIPIFPFLGSSQRFSADCSVVDLVDNVTFVPLVPLDGNSIYTAVVLDGVEDTSGTVFAPSSTWALVRQPENPVTIEDGSIVAENTPLNPAIEAERAALIGIDQLWKAHAPPLYFLEQALEVSRADIVLAWDIKTQTITDPLDMAVAGSPAASLPTTTLPANAVDLNGGVGFHPIDGGDPAAYIDGALPGTPCDDYPCGAIGTIWGGTITSSNYQPDQANPLGSEAAPIPGAWSNPIDPELNGPSAISVTAIQPGTSAPAGGYPVVIYGHGINKSRQDLLRIGSQLAAKGIASIAIDWVAHGSPASNGRAVQVDDTSVQCTAAPDPTDTVTGGAACFSPMLSSDLKGTRDNIRQSVLDVQALINTLKLCTADACGSGFDIDPLRIGYMGQSLGAIFGTVATAMTPDIKSAVFNVGGVGLVDIIDGTKSLTIRCSLIDALIEVGILEGDLFDPMAGEGLCLDDGWNQQPGWVSFANVARWILDPADGANYAPRLRARSVLVQEVIDDATVPNVSTSTLGALLGLQAVPAAAPDGSTITPTTAITGAPGAPLFIQYTSQAAGGSFLGRTYDHGALLEPANGNQDGSLALEQLQTDAITFIEQGLAP